MHHVCMYLLDRRLFVSRVHALNICLWTCGVRHVCRPFCALAVWAVSLIGLYVYAWMCWKVWPTSLEIVRTMVQLNCLLIEMFSLVIPIKVLRRFLSQCYHLFKVALKKKPTGPYWRRAI